MLSFLTLLLMTCLVFASEEGPEVSIKQGTLRGYTQKSRGGKTFSGFRAIPYAKPPVGELRFKPPIAGESWEGVLDATKPHPVCPQTDLFTRSDTIIGDENCLYLNIYTPQLPASERELLPVMFYIHGGGWFTGSANIYNPDYLIDKDVVLVTVNYRLGALGFYTTGDSNALGNFGLKDQALAIKWVKENIEKFGGDPDSITLFGQSAGGASAHFHMLSPLSKDLIKGVIAQSGTAFAHWALMPHFFSTRRSMILSGDLGCPGFVKNEMIECMRKVEAYSIINQTKTFVQWDMDPIIPFKPVIEPNIPGAFLPGDPLALVKAKKFVDVPFMSGLTTDEGAVRTAALYSQPELVKELDEKFEEIAPVLLMYREMVAVKYEKTTGPKIRQFYFADQPIDESTKHKFTEMYSDALILSGEDVAVDLHAKYSKNPVYYYLFGYRGSASYCTIFGADPLDTDVCHGDELLYLFNHQSIWPHYEPTESDNKMTDFLTTLWTNFAKHGNPTPDTDPTLVKWEPVKTANQNYYYIKSDSDVKVTQGLYEERAAFWKNLPLNGMRTMIKDEL